MCIRDRFSALALTICVTFWMFSEEPTEVPPNFKTFIIDDLIRDRCCSNNFKYDDNYDIMNPKGVITVDTVIPAVIPKKDKVLKMSLDIISLRKCIA